MQGCVCTISSLQATEMPHGSPGGAISQMVGVFGKLVNTRCRRIELGDRAVLADGVATILLSLLFVVFQEGHTLSLRQAAF